MGSFVGCQQTSIEDKKCSVTPAQKGPVFVDNSSEAVISGEEDGHQDRVVAVMSWVRGDGMV